MILNGRLQRHVEQESNTFIASPLFFAKASHYHDEMALMRYK
jgi:hypothetical protein